jgi:hypothetical protein
MFKENGLFSLNLQMFAEDVPEGASEATEDVDTTNLVTDEVNDEMDSSYDDYENDDVEDEVEDIEDTEEDTEDTEDVEDDAEDLEDDVEFDEEAQQDEHKLFDEKQQKKVDEIVSKRLERQQEKLLKDLKEAAGTDIEQAEITNAARLWGLLKENPDLSRLINQTIQENIQQGKAKVPSQKTIQSKEVELQRKEAILDLKSSDKTFNKNADKILNWAESQGFDISDSKDLKIAYMAWKGSNSNVIEATKKFNAKRRQSKKDNVRKKASVQSSKSGKPKKSLDYRRMSDEDILSSEGLSLFVEE